MRKLLATCLLITSGSSIGHAFCIASSQEGFTMPGRSGPETHYYNCTNHDFQYFARLNYTIQPDITCNNTQWLSHVEMRCENRSHQERRVGNVGLLCCDNPNGN